MSDAEQVKKLLEAYGLESLMNVVQRGKLDEVESVIKELGGVENVLKVPPPPPPRPNPAFGIPDPRIAAGTAE